MKIGILTQPLWFNYGGILQNYALQIALKRLGHEVYTINRQPSLSYKLTLKHIISFFYRFMKRFFLGRSYVQITWKPGVSRQIYNYISKNTLKFVSSNISITESVYPNELKDLVRQYQFNAYVVGSDQVWISSYFPEAFIPFDNRCDIKKIFYAASSGLESWLDNEKIRNKALKMTANFNAISVREKSLVDKFSLYSSRTIYHVLDPTLLLEKSDYMKFVTHDDSQNAFIFSYILDNNSYKTEIVNKLSKALGLEIVSGTPKYSYINVPKNQINNAVFEPVENWLSNYYSSDFIITDSFHGMVFSLIFNKQFLVIGNKERGLDRFLSFLEDFGLEERLIINVDDIEALSYKQINYNLINKRIADRREYSIRFLNESLCQ